MSGKAVRLEDAVLLTGSAIEAAAYAVNVARIDRAQKMHAPSPELEHLARVLSPPCPRGPHRDRSGGAGEDDELMTTTAVAALLTVTPRHVRRLAPGLDARKVGGRLLFPRRAVTEHLEGRTA